MKEFFKRLLKDETGAFGFLRFLNGLRVIPKTTSTSSEAGDMEVLSSDSRLRFYNGNVNDPVVTQQSVDLTFKNKTIDASQNTLLNITDSAISSSASVALVKLAPMTASMVVQSDSNGHLTASGLSASQLPWLTSLGSTAVGISDTQTLTNKTINGNNNTITNIPSSAISSVAALKALQSDASGFLQASSVSASELAQLSGILSKATGISDTQTLTNKTIAAGSNTISGLTNTNLSGSAAITNANLASMNNNTVKGNTSGSSGTPSDLSLGDVSVPSILSVSGGSKAVIGSGLTLSLASESPNAVFAGPGSGTASSVPTFRALVSADIPALSNSNLNGSAGITNANLATMSNNTVKGNTSGNTATPSDLALGNITVPAIMSVSGGTDAVIGSGVTLSLNAESPNVVLSGPSSGTASSVPTFRALVSADIPTLSLTSKVSGVLPIANGGTNNSTSLNNNRVMVSSAGSIAELSSITASKALVSDANGLPSASVVSTSELAELSGILSKAVGVSDTQTLTNKTWGDSPTFKEISTPSSPSSGYLKIYPKTDDNLYTLNSSGSEVKLLTAGNSFVAPTIQKFTSTGTTTGYLFTCSTANATVGATYTNNSNTYTVLATISSENNLFCSGASAPTSSGTLTKASGTGDATITFSANQTLATYTTPVTTPLYLKIKMVGGGGGGGGSGTGGIGPGGAGTATTFGSKLLIANGGTGGQFGTTYGQGGTASLGTAIGTSFTGSSGSGGGDDSISGVGVAGGIGGTSPFGGGGFGAQPSGANGPQAGGAAAANTGSGGGGASGFTVSGGSTSGGGGGSGGYIEAIITSPGASYFYSVGTKGAGGTAGTSGAAGGAGADGYIVVEEHYQ